MPVTLGIGEGISPVEDYGMRRLVQLSDGEWYAATLHRGRDTDNGGAEGWIVSVDGSAASMWMPYGTPLTRG